MDAPLPLPARVNCRDLHWDYVITFTSIHMLALLAAFPYFFSWIGVAAWLLSAATLGQFGIPICYHRQLTHRSFATPKWLERAFVVMALCNAQETPAKWVSWHRKHHQESDEQEDPHTPKVNFAWAHTGWLCLKNRSMTDIWFYQKYARDILADPFYLYLERNYLAVVWIYLVHAALIFFAAWGLAALVLTDRSAALQIAASVLVWGVFVRTVYIWHITWSVNSLSHMFGYRNHNTPDDSRNNWFVAIITGGEGWHNNHHADQAAATVRHRWWEIDMNFWLIRTLAAVGLASQIVPTRSERLQASPHYAASLAEASLADTNPDAL